MALVLADGGEAIALNYLVNKVTTQEDLVLRLYTNDITPGETDTAATYTQASGNGYSAISLTGATWTISGTAPTQAAYPEQTFTFTGALGNVYGYYIVRASTLDLVWSERFTAAPFNVQNNGDTIKITPVITMS